MGWEKRKLVNKKYKTPDPGLFSKTRYVIHSASVCASTCLKKPWKNCNFFLKNRHFLTICFWFCFYTKPALFCLTPSSLFLSAQNSKQKKSLNHSIIIIHNPIKKSELILINASTPPTPLKSSDDPFDPLHIRLVEMFRFVFKNWKNIHWFDKKTF